VSDKTDLPKAEQSLHHSKGKSAQAGDGMWGGRFNESTDEFVQAFTASVTFDQRMYRQDIRGSRAHATMLERTGVISKSDHDAIQLGLNEVEDQINSGTFDWSVALEDVHMNIESALTARIGDAGKRLHTGRSRNDQVATDIRLYLRDACDELAVQLLRLLNGLLPLAEAHKATIMPGFTHLQTAQPVTFGHHVMAWFEMLLRDLERLNDTRNRMTRLPLGAAALAGTSYPIDREITRELLGFDAVCENAGVVDVCPVSVYRSPRSLLHRLIDHAAEKKSGCARAGARQNRSCLRQPDVFVDADEKSATGLQQR